MRALRHVLPYVDIEEIDRAGAIADEAGLDAPASEARWRWSAC